MKNIFVIGFMGSGKTTLSKAWAKKLNKRFVDLDSYIEHQHEKSIEEIFETQGEDEFRKLEREALRNCTRVKDLVISCGGGTPCYYDNLDFMLQNGKVVYISLPNATLLQRLEQKKQKSRPLLNGFSGKEKEAKISELMAERSVFYEKAHLTVYPLQQSATEIIELVSKI